MSDEAPLERALFRETEDGRVVYFPWGLTRQGYRLPSPESKKPASRAAGLMIGSVLAIGTWTAYELQPLIEMEETTLADFGKAVSAPIVALAIVLLAYYVWTLRFVENLPESSLRISRSERLREAATLTKPWKITVIGLITCGLSGLVIWIEPNGWWLGIAGIAVGAGLVWWSLLMKRSLRPPS